MNENTIPKSRLQHFLFVVMLAGVGKLLALAREVSSAYIFGVSAEFGAFLIALSFVSVVIIILDDTLTPFITTSYAETQKTGSAETAGDFAGATLLGLTLTILPLAAIIYLVAPAIVAIVVVGFSPQLQESVVYLIRLLLPFFCFNCLVNFMGVMQQCHDKFTLPALNGSVLNIVFMAFIFFSINSFGIFAAVIAYNFAFFLLTILHYQAVKKAGIRFSIKGVRGKLCLLPSQIKILSLWSGLSFFKNIEPFIDYLLVSFISASAMAVFSYASKVNIFIYSLIVVPFTAVFLPYFSRLAAEYDLQTFNRSVIRNLRLYILLLLPAAGFMIIFRQEIITLVYQRGAFDVLAANDTSLTLAILSVGLPFLGILEVLKNAFAGQKKTGVLLAVYSLGFFLKLIIGLALASKWGIMALALANTSYIIIISTALLLIYMQSDKLGIDTVSSVSKTIAGVLIAGASLWVVPGVKIAAGFLLYVAVFCVAARMLRHRDFDELLGEVKQYLYAKLSRRL